MMPRYLATSVTAAAALTAASRLGVETRRIKYGRFLSSRSIAH